MRSLTATGARHRHVTPFADRDVGQDCRSDTCEMAGFGRRLTRLHLKVGRWSRRNRPSLIVSVAVVFFAAFVMLLWRGPTWLDSAGLRGLTPGQRETAVDAIRGRVIQLGAGLLAAGALLYTALNFRLSREGHVTDRYTRAIEQLGSERLDVRLGAIYALERIMVDSVRDHPTIVEVLAAFIREHSPVGAATANHPRPTTDVLAAAAVLGRRPSERKECGGLDLRTTSLVGANLASANLAGADLTGSDLANANLRSANLSDTDLTGTNLANADMAGANLTNAFALSANMRKADLSNADLTDTNLEGACLPGAHLMRARLIRTKLTVQI